LQFRLNRPSRRARYVLLHAHTGRRYPRTLPADASTAWRPAPHMAREPQPRSGALAGAAAGPAGRAVENPYAAAAALSNAPGIGAAGSSRPRSSRRPFPASAGRPSQTTPPHGAMQRGRRRRGNLEDHPRPREQIRLPQGPVSACKLPREIRLGPLNLFHSVQTKTCLGHCITRGIGLRRQATIFRLRGAVLFARPATGPGIRRRTRG
jgi:hypothetical protein